MGATLYETVNGDQGYVEQIRHYITGAHKSTDGKLPQPPFSVKAWWTAPGEGARGPLIVDESVTTLKGFDVAVLGEAIEQALIKHAGAAPYGRIELKFYAAGTASTSPVWIKREIDPGDGDALRMMPHNFLVTELHRQRGQNTEYASHMVTAMGHLTAALGVANSTIGTLATARTATSSAADVAGPWAMIGFVLFFLAFPMVQKMLGLPPGASLPETIEHLMKMRDAVSAKWGDKVAARPPERAALTDDGAPKAAVSDNGDLTVRQIEWMLQAFEGLRDDPDQLAQVLQVAERLDIDVSAFAS